MFQLKTETTVRLMHINVRTEKHGPNDVDAMDVEFAMEGQNTKVLALLHPALCEALYAASGDVFGTHGAAGTRSSSSSHESIGTSPLLHVSMRWRMCVFGRLSPLSQAEIDGPDSPSCSPAWIWLSPTFARKARNSAAPRATWTVLVVTSSVTPQP